MAARSGPARGSDKATELTSIIATPRDQYAKVRWNFGRYIKEQSNWEPKADGVVFAAIDFAKAVSALIDWLDKEGSIDRSAMMKRVRWLGALRTIANVAKHSSSKHDYWPGGHIFVQLVATDGNEVRIFAGPSPKEIEKHLPAWKTAKHSRWEMWLIKEGKPSTAAVVAFSECLKDLKALLEV